VVDGTMADRKDDADMEEMQEQEVPDFEAEDEEAEADGCAARLAALCALGLSGVQARRK
jgi:hypothetical protein